MTQVRNSDVEKRQNFDPSTPPASTENLHFTLNGETRRTPGHSPTPTRLGKMRTRSSSTHPASRSGKVCKNGSGRKTPQEMGKTHFPREL
jgi:hypothetical protein